MKIADIKVHRLLGATVDGGWPDGHEPEDDLHTLLEVETDEGLTGVGSVFTSSALTIAGLEQLKPMWQVFDGANGIQKSRILIMRLISSTRP